MNFKLIAPNRGFTLIEALVTVLVMSVGLLGFATLQNTSTKFTYDAYLRTQSSLLASDLFDRMRANPSVNYRNINATTATDCSVPAAVCDQDTIMQYDLTQWRARRDELFPLSTTVTSINSSAPFNTYTITFLWDSRTEDGDATVEGDTTAEGRQLVTYTARVK